MRLQSLEDRRVLAAVVSIEAMNATVPEDPREEIVFRLTRDETTEPLAVKIQISGDAAYDVDYRVSEKDNDTLFLPEDPAADQPVIGVVNFPADQATVDVLVTPLSDAVEERDEAIDIEVMVADRFELISGSSTLLDRDEPTEYYVAGNGNRLGTVDVETGLITTIGVIDAELTVTDITFTENGDLFAITEEELYQVFPNQIDGDGVILTRSLGEHEIIGANALIDARDGDFGSAEGEDLFAVGTGSLVLQGLDLEIIDDQFELVGVFPLFDIAAELASKPFPFEYVSSGDLDYVNAGHLVLSARQDDDAFDSLIRIETPQERGEIDTAPTPAQDPGEDFVDIFGLAFDGNDSYAISDYTLLNVNQFSLDVSRKLELTGREYLVGIPAIATGVIEGDPVDPPVVALNTLAIDPPDLPRGPQPTSWLAQRSELHDIVIDLGAPIFDVPAGSIELTNLGVEDADTDQVVPLRQDQIVLEPGGERISITLDPNQLDDGRYELRLAESISSGPEFSFAGDRFNRFYALDGDFDGNNSVDLEDLDTFVYWFGTSGLAPQYVNLDGATGITVADLDVFVSNFASSIELPGGSTPVDPALIDLGELQRARLAIINPLDVNGSGAVSPRDALNVINRLARMAPGIIDWKFDANRDGLITPRDALRIINQLAADANSGSEGEQPVGPSGRDGRVGSAILSGVDTLFAEFDPFSDRDNPDRGLF